MQIQLKSPNQTYTFEARSGEPLLHAGIRHGLELPYGCASGTCGTCLVKRLAGNVANGWLEAPGLSGVDPQAREFLMCQCAALDDVVMETRSHVYRSDAGACAVGRANGILRTRPAIARDIMEFAIDLDSPMSFEAGQFVALAIPGIAGRRVYSMTHFNRNARRLEFVVKRKAAGAFSMRLFTGSCDGLPVEVFGPLGRATFLPSIGKNLLVIAGGSGIAGMMSILSRAVEEGYFVRHAGHVFFGVRAWADAFYLERLAAMVEAARGRLKVTVALSDEDVPPGAVEKHPALAFVRGLVHEVAIRGMNGQYANVRAYVAGPPPAVDAALRVLVREAKLPRTEIRYDKFG